MSSREERNSFANGLGHGYGSGLPGAPGNDYGEPSGDYTSAKAFEHTLEMELQYAEWLTGLNDYQRKCIAMGIATYDELYSWGWKYDWY